VASAGKEVELPSRSAVVAKMAKPNTMIGERRRIRMIKGSPINQSTNIFPSD